MTKAKENGMQEVIAKLFMSIADAGMLTNAYYFINNIGNYAAIAFGLIHARKLRVHFLTAVIAIIIERELFGYIMTGVLFVENGFEPTALKNAVVAYPYIPLLAWLVAKLLKQSWKTMWDVMMPDCLVAFVGARISCTVTGCCYGYPCSWGIYNVQKGEYLFPIQLLEAFAAVIILVAMVKREKKNGFIPDGRNVPLILISYGVLRFFLEYLHDNEKIIAGLASTQFHCLIMIAVGIISLRILKKSEQNKS